MPGAVKQNAAFIECWKAWIPACAGMTTSDDDGLSDDEQADAIPTIRSPTTTAYDNPIAASRRLNQWS